MNKLILIAAAIVIIIGIGAVSILINFSSSESIAKIESLKGDVSVNNQKAVANMDISKGATIKTGPNSTASILFHGSSALRLDENTAVSLKDITINEDGRVIIIDQESGNTWNRILRVSGIDTYEVQTANSVATVRGTGFWVSLYGIGVIDGTVNFKSESETISVGQEEQVEITGNGLKKKALERNAWIYLNEDQDNKLRINVKEKLKNKYSNLISIAKSTYGLTDQQIDEYLDNYVSGKYTKEQIEEAKRSSGINFEPTL